MNRDDIIRMAREAGFRIDPEGEVLEGDDWHIQTDVVQRFATFVAAAEREKVAKWMIQHSYATGHGDTTEDLLIELDWQIAENWNRAMINGIETERQRCHDFLMNLHMQAGGKHNYYHVAANQLLEEE